MNSSSAAVFLLLYTSVLSCVLCQQSIPRNPSDSTKIDVVCSKALGCISDCRQSGFCLDKRVHRRRSPSYILDDHVLFLRAHLVRITNESVVALIQESFQMPLSLFSAETFPKSTVRQAEVPLMVSLFDTFGELKAHDKTLSGLKEGDPYCVWQRNLYYTRELTGVAELGICNVSPEQEGLAVATVWQVTGSFGFKCGVRRFGS